MSKFFDKVSWPKVVLMLGGFVLMIAAIVLFPDAFKMLSETGMGWARAFAEIFTGGTE